MILKLILGALLIVSVSLAHAEGNAEEVQLTQPTLRGKLLYSTHCIACHNVKIHWRDNKAASDWSTLYAEVMRWQTVSGLHWGHKDIEAVAQYLNVLHYHYPVSN